MSVIEELLSQHRYLRDPHRLKFFDVAAFTAPPRGRFDGLLGVMVSEDFAHRCNADSQTRGDDIRLHAFTPKFQYPGSVDFSEPMHAR
jgi:hypothetical protein